MHNKSYEALDIITDHCLKLDRAKMKLQRALLENVFDTSRKEQMYISDIENYINESMDIIKNLCVCLFGVQIERQELTKNESLKPIKTKRRQQ